MKTFARCAGSVLALSLTVPAALPFGPSGVAQAQDSSAAQSVPQGGQDAADKIRMLRSIKMPPGFHIALYALVPSARSLAIDPVSGDVFVGTRKDFVWRIHKPGPGQAEVTSFEPQVGFKDPNGVCFAPDGTMFVVELNRVLKFDPETDGDNTPAEHDIVAQDHLIPTKFAIYNHGARVCTVGPDNRLYMALGEPINVMPKEDYDIFYKAGMGAINVINQDGSDRQVYAHGLRNSVGVAFSPVDHTLWFTDNQVDGMGDDQPPGELNHATKAGENFGYPWYGGGHTRTVLWKDTTPPEGVVFPVVETIAHAADLGLTFYTGGPFPSRYRDGLFSVQHGSWNRTVPVGARVLFTHVEPDGSAHMTVFASGWLKPDHSYQGRPVDVKEMKDGSLLVSDDFGGAVYRITYTGK